MNPFDNTSLSPNEPDAIVAGSYAAWRRLLEYSSADYSLRYDLVPRAGGTTLTVTGTQDGDYWRFVVPSAASGAWTAGEYRMNLVLIRSSDSEEAEVETGSVTIFASTEDRRTHAEIMVEKIQTLLDGRAAHDIESYSIKSRSISRMSVAELLKWRDYYLDEVARTRGSVKKRTGANPSTLRVRFV